jgi:hypothetical protein
MTILLGSAFFQLGKALPYRRFGRISVRRIARHRDRTGDLTCSVPHDREAQIDV